MTVLAPPPSSAESPPRVDAPPPTPVMPARTPAPAPMRTVALVLAMLSVSILALAVNLVLISQVQNYTSQKALYDELRVDLAGGAAPTGPEGVDGELIEPGTPVALLTAPEIGLPRSVIVEGTAGAQTMAGIGHRRDTVLPCQYGTSVLMARSGAYGAAGAAFKALREGDRFGITMGQGSCTYEVTGIRFAGDQAPPAPRAGQGRITLTTAAGLPFMPTAVYRVDAELVSDGYDRPAVAIPAGALPESEAAMGTDTSALYPLVLLLELMIAVALFVVWLWRRWGRWQAWLIGIPPILAVGLLTAGLVNQWLLPNLL